jgi:hypothetical protein
MPDQKRGAAPKDYPPPLKTSWYAFPSLRFTEPLAIGVVRLATDAFIRSELRYSARAMANDQPPHLVNLGEDQQITLGELFRRLAEHEKADTDRLKADALKREEERAKQSIQPAKKRKA